MTTDSQPLPGADAERPLTAGRMVIRVLAVIAGIIGGLLCYFICYGVFSGYPQYGTDILTYIALAAIMATGGVAWIIDHRRIEADE
jgi:hypothetical protein